MAAGVDESRQERPTYGNWRKPKTAGLPRLGLGGSVLLLVGIIIVVLTMLIDPLVAGAMAVLLAVLLAPLALSDVHGRTLLTRMIVRVGWSRATRSGAPLYRSGLLGRTGHGTCTLPGLAAASRLREAADAWGRPFGLLTYPQTNHHVVVLTCAADGDALVDDRQVDTWVASWGEWLAKLATEPGLVSASVTVETAPDPGLRLQREVEGHLSQDAPELATRMLRETVATYPTGSAHITTRIALTYSGAARDGRPRADADGMAILLGNQLPSLTGQLAMTGAGAARPMSATEISEAVRIAYDPSAEPLIEDAREHGGSGLTWDDAGPAAAEEYADAYWHDAAWSRTWHMSEAPRGEVVSEVLTTLLEPHADIARKRVTLHYRPHDPASGARIVERDHRDATFRVSSADRPKARDKAEEDATEQSAREEARGAAVVRFAATVTATVYAEDDLPAASAAITNLAPQARIRVRPVDRGHAAAFAAGLPIGLVLPLHLALPDALREKM